MVDCLSIKFTKEESNKTDYHKSDPKVHCRAQIWTFMILGYCCEPDGPWLVCTEWYGFKVQWMDDCNVPSEWPNVKVTDKSRWNGRGRESVSNITVA